jgi:hypothetical protein
VSASEPCSGPNGMKRQQRTRLFPQLPAWLGIVVGLVAIAIALSSRALGLARPQQTFLSLTIGVVLFVGGVAEHLRQRGHGKDL